MLLYDVIEGKEYIPEKGNINVISSSIYRKYRKENWHSKYMHSQTLNQVIINLIGNYKSYKALEEMYEKDPKSLKGKPRVPRYKGEDGQEIVFGKEGIRVEKSKIKLSISKEMQNKHKVKSIDISLPRKVRNQIEMERIKIIRVKYKKEKIEMYIIYERDEKEKTENTNIMAIDLGLNNLAACTNKENTKAMLVSGKEIKSKNKYINEKIKHYQSIMMKMIKDSKKYKNTKRIKKLYEYRKRYMETVMHRASKEVIKYAKENKCKVIVIGDIKDIKQNMKRNSSFVQIPLQSLVEKIEYKAKLEGIEVKKISEAYTSGVSSLDKEEISKENYNPRRRIHRGIFVSNKGKKINADINGSLNILRKYIKKSSPKEEIQMDNGREQLPIKKRVAC